MSREIKFRAWDTIHGTMSNNFTLLDCINQNQAFFLPENFGFMEYTGLKDKHGVGIYEGDVVTTENGNRIVEYIAAEFCLCKPEWLEQKQSGRFGNYFIDSDSFSTPMAVEEVIGNIYENQELLEEQP